MKADKLLEEIKSKIDIVEFISDYVQLKKAGQNFKGLCPFHAEKTPSFMASQVKQIFHCFGCGVGGDAFKFVELQEGLNFPEAIKKLAARAGITLPQDTRDLRQDKRSEDEQKTLLKIVADAAEFFNKELDSPAGSAARAYRRTCRCGG